MAVVQSTYSETISAANAGMPADADYSAISRIVEEANGIGFGLACQQGTNDKQAKLGGASAAVFAGISIRDRTLVNAVGEEADEYQDESVMSLMIRGEIWVTVGGNVSAGNDVTFAASTGVLSSAATSGSQFAIAGARWMTSASSGGLAKLRLGGALPSA